MIEIFKDKQTSLEFRLDISGNSFEPDARLSVALNEYISLTFKGELEGSLVKVTIPPLKDIILNSNIESVSMKLEVIADQNYFIPWKGTAMLNNSISVGVLDVQTESIDAKKDISVTSSIVTKNHSFKFI